MGMRPFDRPWGDSKPWVFRAGIDPRARSRPSASSAPLESFYPRGSWIPLNRAEYELWTTISSSFPWSPSPRGFDPPSSAQGERSRRLRIASVSIPGSFLRARPARSRVFHSPPGCSANRPDLQRARARTSRTGSPSGRWIPRASGGTNRADRMNTVASPAKIQARREEWERRKERAERQEQMTPDSKT